MSLLIIGEPREGKSYSARYIVEQLHQRNKYKHLLLITKKSSYLNCLNVISGIARINQVIWWDCLGKKQDKQEMIKHIEGKCGEWAKNTTTQQTLVVVDDMTDAMRNGELSFQRLLTEGSHLRTDLVVIYHGFPPALPSLRSLRDNIKNVLMTNSNKVNDICEKTEWLPYADKKNAYMVIEHAQSFIRKTDRIQGLIKRGLASEERPISEYFVPFKASLSNPQNDLLRGVVGSEADALQFLKGHSRVAFRNFFEELKNEYNEMTKHKEKIRVEQKRFEDDMRKHFSTHSTPQPDMDEQDMDVKKNGNDCDDESNALSNKLSKLKIQNF
jgi:hypothetical protein